MNYRELLTKHDVIRQLSILQLIAYFAAWFSNVAIYTMLVEFNSSAFAISLVTAMHFIPAIIIAPLSGAIIDRFKIKPLMISLLSVELLMTLLFLIVNSKVDLWLLMIFIFIRMASASMFFSTEMSLLPKLISGIALQKANEIHSIIWSFTFAAGMALSGVVVNLVGVKLAITIDALIILGAIILLLNINFKVEIIHTKDKLSSLIKGGFLYLKQNKIVVHLIILHSSVGLTIFDTIVTLLAKNEYKYVISVPLAIGLTNAFRAMALMVGPFLISNWVNKDRLFYIFIFQGFAIVFWAMVQSYFYISLLAIFFVGLTTTTLWSYTYALLQESTDKEYIGRVISYKDMIFMVVTVLTTLFIGIMAEIVSLKIVTSILGIAFFIVAFYYRYFISLK